MPKFRYAAVPFEAVARFHELTPQAALLYVHYCQWRNKGSGLAWPSLSLIASTMHIQKAVACRLRQQLVERGWLELVEGDRVRLLVGFAQEATDKPAQNHAESVDKLSTEALINCQQPVDKSSTEALINCQRAVDNLSMERCQIVNGALTNYQRHIKKNNTKEQHYRKAPGGPPTLTALTAPHGAGAGAESISAVYSLEVCREYAQHLHDTGQGVKDPEGFARALYHDTGELAARHRAALAAWLAAREQAAAAAAEAELKAAREAHEARYKPLYYETYLWPAVERLLLTENSVVDDLRQELQSWDKLGPREDLRWMKYDAAERFLSPRPSLGVLPFQDWDRLRSAPAYPQSAPPNGCFTPGFLAV